MNKLQLVQRFCREAGISFSGPSTTIAQTGQFRQAVDWIDAAYEDIQFLHENWNFLREDFTFSTSDAVLAIPELGSWKGDSFRCYQTSLGVVDEQELCYIPWDAFRDAYLYGSSRTETGRPTVVSVKPDKSLSLWPTAVEVYTVVCEYYMKPQTLDADADTPIFPDAFHMAIVWKALSYYGIHASEPDKDLAGQREFKRLIPKLEFRELPKWQWGAPLA